eukprot:8591086-Prorocentrum_lima.AAC.1
MPPLPRVDTPPRMSTPGASSHVQVNGDSHQLRQLHTGLLEKQMDGIRDKDHPRSEQDHTM